jgi:hypothetical protein
MTHALSFVSMGVDTRCCSSKSTAHRRHMKRQPFLCNGCPHHGCCHCHCHLHCHCRLHCRRHCHHRRHCCCNLPSLLLLPSAIAVAVAVNHCCRHLCCVALSHRCCRCPCRWPLPSPSPLAIAVTLPSAIIVAMPSAISKSCCLGAARIVFNQLKQRILTLFYFVRTVGGALIKAT